MVTRSIRFNEQEEKAIAKITKFYNLSYKDLIKKYIYDAAEDLADISFIENNKTIGKKKNLAIPDVEKYIDSL